MCPRSYQKIKLLPLKKDFSCKHLYGSEFNKHPNIDFSLNESIKNLAPYGRKLIKLFINENKKKEKQKEEQEENLYKYKHSKPPLLLNPWKFSNHIIEEFSRPKADVIHGFREKQKTKYQYNAEPFRRPKEIGDYFDKKIGLI